MAKMSEKKRYKLLIFFAALMIFGGLGSLIKNPEFKNVAFLILGIFLLATYIKKLSNLK